MFYVKHVLQRRSILEQGRYMKNYSMKSIKLYLSVCKHAANSAVVWVSLHPLILDKIEDVALGGDGQVQPDAGHQVSQRATSWDVRAPPNEVPPTQHLQHTDITVYIL